MKISDLGNFTSTFLLMTSFFGVQSAPARPLNERSTEFAWVILDEQQSDSSPRRKITPKSIFISPSFSTQSCSAGYTLDANGRCVKVVKLDTNAHEQFVLNQFLSQNFGESYEDYDDEVEGEGVNVGDEPLPTPGPFQFNIPLAGMDAERDKISIIVAPTNGNFEDSIKLEDMKTSQLDAPFIVTNINIKDDVDPGKDANDSLGKASNDTRAANTTTTAGSVLAATATTTTTTPSTVRYTGKNGATSSTTTPTTVVVSTGREDDTATTITTEAIDTTTIDQQTPEQQAIFFKLPAGTGDIAADTPPPPSTFPDRPAFDEALFHDFLQEMNKQVNRRFVTKSTDTAATYSNHRNRDRWLFPRLVEDERRVHR